MNIRPITNYYAFKFMVDPDDLHQEIHLRILQRGHQYTPQDGASFNTWVSRVTHNYCIDMTRKKSNVIHASIENHDIAMHPPNDFETRQELARVIRYVRAAWPRSARENTQVLWLTMLGYKIHEIAAKTGIHESTIKTKLHRIRKLFEK